MLLIPKEDLLEVVKSAVKASLAEREQEQKDVLLTRKAVCERLHVDASTLWRWAKTKYLVPIHQGRAVYYSETDVIAIEEGRYE